MRLGAALGVENLHRDAAFLENAGPLAELRDGGIPLAALRHRDLQQVLGTGGRERRKQSDENDNRGERRCGIACHHDVLPGPDFPVPVDRHPSAFCDEMRLPIPMHAFE